MPAVRSGHCGSPLCPEHGSHAWSASADSQAACLQAHLDDLLLVEALEGVVHATGLDQQHLPKCPSAQHSHALQVSQGDSLCRAPVGQGFMCTSLVLQYPPGSHLYRSDGSCSGTGHQHAPNTEHSINSWQLRPHRLAAGHQGEVVGSIGGQQVLQGAQQALKFHPAQSQQVHCSCRLHMGRHPVSWLACRCTCCAVGGRHRQQPVDPGPVRSLAGRSSVCLTGGLGGTLTEAARGSLLSSASSPKNMVGPSLDTSCAPHHSVLSGNVW